MARTHNDRRHHSSSRSGNSRNSRNESSSKTHKRESRKEEKIVNSKNEAVAKEEQIRKKRKLEEEKNLYIQKVKEQLNQLSEVDMEEKARQRRLRIEAIKEKYENKKEPTETQNPNPTTLSQSEAVEPEKLSEPKNTEDSSDSGSFDMFGLESPHLIEELDTKQLRKIQGTDQDDEQGYYAFTFGEYLNDRYRVVEVYGRGVFSICFRAIDTQDDDRTVAIKVLRNNEAMKRVGRKEISTLKLINGKDPLDKYHCVRLIHDFDFQDRLCLVFEPLSSGTLRDLLNRYGKGTGFSLLAVQTYAKQLFLALHHLKNHCKIIHADIKLDNVLVNESKNSIKLSDFGSALDSLGSMQITKYLAACWYRAPEIILGHEFSYPVDMWAVGLVLYELFTGKFLFTACSNNAMLYSILQVTGKISKKYLRLCSYARDHFDEQGCFIKIERDPVSGGSYVKLLQTIPGRDLKGELLTVDGPREGVAAFVDLLTSILTIDPARRLSPEQALQHPFCTSKIDL